MKKILLSLLTIMFSLQIVFAQSLQKVVVEEFTGAWCGYCPEGAEILENLATSNSNVIPVSIHQGDAMYFSSASPIGNFYSPAYPQAIINRGGGPISRGAWANAVAIAAQASPRAYVSFDNVNYDPNTRIVTVTVKATFAQADTGQFRFNVMVVEKTMQGSGNGWDQTNYFDNTPGSSFYQLGNPIPNYVHHHVLRQLYGGAWGTPAQIPVTVAANESFTYTYTKLLPAYIPANNVELVATVHLHGGQTPASRPILNAESMSLDLAIGVEDGINAQSDIMEVYPNPSTGQVTVAYTLESMGEIKLEVLNQLGQHVVTLGQDWTNSGTHSVIWDGNNSYQQPVANGLYIVRLITNNGQSLMKKVLVNR